MNTRRVLCVLVPMVCAAGILIGQEPKPVARDAEVGAKTSLQDVDSQRAEYKAALRAKQGTGFNTHDAEKLAARADQALAEGDRKQYMRLMEKAVRILREGNGATASSPSLGAREPAPSRAVCERSPFGMICMSPIELPGASRDYYADLGVRWDNGPCFVWNEVQRDLRTPRYNWSQPKLKNNAPSYDDDVNAFPPTVCRFAEFKVAPESHRSVGYLKPGSYAPTDERLYSQFVQHTVERYDGDGVADMPGLRSPIHWWHVESEPVYGSDYPLLLRLTYEAVKKADPGAKVAMGATFGQPEVCDEYFDKFHGRFLRELKGKYLDIFVIHWYGDAYGDYRKLADFHRKVRQSLSRNGYPESVEIWIQEMGTYSGLHKEIRGNKKKRILITPRVVSEELHAADVLKRYVFSLSLGVKKIFLDNLMEGYEGDETYFDFLGLIYDGRFGYDRGLGTKKLAYFTYKLMTEKLEGSDWTRVSSIPTAVRNVYAFRLVKSATNKSAYVVWWDWFDETDDPKGKAKRVGLKVDEGAFLLTSAITKPDGSRTSRELTAGESGLSFSLGADPVFIEQLP